MKNNSIQSLLKDYLDSGSEESLTQFFQSISQLMYQVAYKYTYNSADAEDCLQNAILYIIEKREQCQKLCDAEETSIKAWCLKIVINMANMKLRQKKSRTKRETIVHDRRDYENNVNELNEKNQMDSHSKKLAETLDELPEKYRVPIYLKYYEGFSLKDIAVSLSLNPNTLRSNVKRGMGQLSEKLKSKGVLLSTTAIVTVLGKMDLSASTTPAIESIVQKAVTEGISGKKYVAAPATGYSFQSILLAILLTGVAAYLIVPKASAMFSEDINANTTSSQPSLIHQWDFQNGIPKDLIVSSFDYNPNKKYPYAIHSKFKALYSQDQHLVQTIITKSIANKMIMFEFTLASQIHKVKNTKNSLAYNIKMIGNKGKPNNGKLVFHRQYTITGPVAKIQMKNQFLHGIITKAYFINNYVFIEIEDEIINIYHFENVDEKAMPVLMLRNFGLIDLAMKEIKTPPEKIAKLLKNMPSGEDPKRFMIDYRTIKHSKKIYPE